MHPSPKRAPVVNSFEAIETYLERVNDRLTNVGIASHLVLDSNQLPPLQQLYNEAITSLNDPEGILGDQFVADSCALVDQMLREHISQAKLSEITRDVSRDEDTGLALISAVKREHRSALMPIAPRRNVTQRLAWMLVAAEDGTAGVYDLHPFLVTVVQRALRWRDENCVAAVGKYLDRLNARVAQKSLVQPPPAPVTLDQLAPLMVLTMVCSINCAITNHLGVLAKDLPPLLHFYSTLFEALKNKNGPLGTRFAKQCRKLIHDSSVDDQARIGEVPCEAQSGLPLVAFLGSDDKEDPATKRQQNMFLSKQSPGLWLQLRASVMVYGPFAKPEVVRKHCYADYVELLSEKESEGELLKFDDIRWRFDVIEAYLGRLNERVVRSGSAAGAKLATLRGLAPFFIATLATLVRSSLRNE
ncbi:hypothetical protein H9P43_006251 [Blastocladiella emersonii ATCC 22665]|nr:hypothetical protein H9P43_006251 [Blastocladiella emersonii ATCC 22665]